MTYKNRNPHRDAPEIDYNVAVIFLPSMFLGTNIGLILSYVMPNIIASIILLVTLLYSVYRTFILGLDLWRKDEHKRPAKFYTDLSDFNHYQEDPEDGNLSDAEEISMSVITESELRQRINKEKLNVSLSTINE